MEKFNFCAVFENNIVNVNCGKSARPCSTNFHKQHYNFLNKVFQNSLLWNLKIPHEEFCQFPICHEQVWGNFDY